MIVILKRIIYLIALAAATADIDGFERRTASFTLALGMIPIFHNLDNPFPSISIITCPTKEGIIGRCSDTRVLSQQSPIRRY